MGCGDFLLMANVVCTCLSIYVRMYICIVLTIVYTQELKSAREFLSLLNSHLSRAVSLLLFIFLTSSVQGTHSHCTDRAFEL